MIRVRLSIVCDQCKAPHAFEHDLLSILQNPNTPPLPRGWSLTAASKEHVCPNCVEKGAGRLEAAMMDMFNKAKKATARQRRKAKR